MKLTQSLPVLLAAASLALSGCVTDPTTGQQSISKTALYGLGGAVTCGIIGAVTHGSKGARNSALACGAVGAGVGGYMDYQEKLLRDKLANSQVEVTRVGDQIKLVMPENITFATNSATLSSSANSSLTSVAGVLAQYTDTTITVSGHTDNTGSDAINQPLSEKRALSVANFLTTHGVAGGRINTVGYGSKMPVAENTTAAGRAKNRRVEIAINPVQTR
ncbi:OmpA family protein [Stenoxybacter acetivorans]|uniref:OmpA family protein n=1 Tax=Stenoxybacter acetivorans TaxID=422441 RepID=UPI000569CA0D|nr:OmpA family protein [Stenoxybacter acetivorans]